MKLVRIVFVFLLTTLSLTSLAQRKTFVGINGGMNFATADLFHTFQGYNYLPDFRTGYQGGIIVMNYLRNHVGIQTGVSYVQKGWVQKFDNGEPSHSTDLDYIELPFLVNIYTGKNALHFFANAGCFFEYMVKSSNDPAPTDPGNSDFVLFEEQPFNKLGYGFKAGGGSFYEFNFGTIMLEVNASYSLSNVYDPESFAVETPNISNKINIGFTVGYLISFGSFDQKD